MDAKFRSLSKQAADCQRYVQRLTAADTLKTHEELAQVIRYQIRSLANDIEDVRLLADEQDKQATQKDILQRLEEYQEQHDQLQTASRQAVIKSRQRIQEKQRAARANLFGAGKDGKSFTEQYELLQRHKSSNADALLKATTNVTEALQRTSTLMQQELEKSSYSMGALADSSKTLSATVNEYQNLGSLLGMSKRLITQLEASDWLDRIVLGLGLLMFCLVVVYIIKKRTYDVGVSLVSWASRGSARAASASSNAGARITSTLTKRAAGVASEHLVTSTLQHAREPLATTVASATSSIASAPVSASVAPSSLISAMSSSSSASTPTLASALPSQAAKPLSDSITTITSSIEAMTTSIKNAMDAINDANGMKMANDARLVASSVASAASTAIPTWRDEL
ncbi:Sec20-domain-containing protein [Gongronella butleri]|nr:Sec20-domain-containing protein [Gongronella butleri]